VERQLLAGVEHGEAVRTALDLLLALALIALFGSLQGCAAMQKERQLMFAPEGLPSNKQVFTHNYSEALKAVDKGSATPTEMVSYVDAGNALLAKNCTDWFDRLTVARRGYVANDHQLGVIGGLLTTLAGAFAWGADAVMALGATQVAIQGFSQNAQQDVLGAPSQYAAQNAVLKAQGTCGDQLLADAPKLKFSQAYLRLEVCARLCSHDAASDAVTRALMRP
jgi:hypothetical protein